VNVKSPELMVQMTGDLTRCWLCGSSKPRLVKPSDFGASLKAEDFKITDASYGSTAAIYECTQCGFLYCPTAPDVLPFYQEMSDTEYERTRPERSIQARQLLRKVAKFKNFGRLLDVGAGTGILVEAARDEGYLAEGVEPSEWLQAQAVERGLDVTLGVLPHADLKGPYDVVAAVDVIEHVNDPLSLLRNIQTVLAPNGIGIVVTPDAASLAARLLGKRWWHYRPAHISYFTKQTLFLALKNAGLRPIGTFRPRWYFPASYLFDRTMQYVPPALRSRAPKFLSRVTVPLNLFDSLLIVFCKA
jgi:SAM-dependent methyltransferase